MILALRKFVRATHLYLGLSGGIFACLMGFTGGIVALRPQIANFLAPRVPAVATCNAAPDWDRAARDLTALSGSEINRIYGPYGSETRWHFRMMTDQPVIYKHLVFDACSGKVLGAINLAWMDWTVDLHHNLLAGHTGRRWAGYFGILMLISGLSGMFLWLAAKPNLFRAMRVRFPFSRATPRELHRAVGLMAAVFLSLEAFTGLWLCFPQTMRGMLGAIAPLAADVRPARGKTASQERAGLGALMTAAENALPGGSVREIRMPEGKGNVQVRMWLPGDFRSLGDNVVSLSSATAQVLTVDRYSDRPSPNRFVQAMAGLHYDEWGGLPFRVFSAAAGLLTPLLLVTGMLLWWYSRRTRSTRSTRLRAEDQPAVAAR